MALAHRHRPDVSDPWLTFLGDAHAHHRRSRDHATDRLADPKCLHRFFEDDHEPRRRCHRCSARRAARRRLRLQLQRAVRPGRPNLRALPRPHPRSPSGEPPRRKRRQPRPAQDLGREDRKSTRLNSSHVAISYAVFCLKKKKNTKVGNSILKKKKYANKATIS